MTIQVLLFARLREICGQARMCVELSAAATVADCFSLLSDRFPELEDLRDSIVVAVNEDYAKWTDHLSDGDTIAFIPPVSGG